jgi:hypothetical protein
MDQRAGVARQWGLCLTFSRLDFCGIRIRTKPRASALSAAPAVWGEAFYAEPAQAVEVTEQLVSAVDEVDDYF